VSKERWPDALAVAERWGCVWCVGGGGRAVRAVGCGVRARVGRVGGRGVWCALLWVGAGSGVQRRRSRPVGELFARCVG
jgi:hypothetical protein